MLVFVGALFWAKGRDPFQRVWFFIRATDHGRAKCVAVLPKTAARPLPVVVYLHGSGGTLLQDGNDLRQMAEMGLAAVAMDYCQTNDAVCEQQLAALLRYLHRQKWADTNAVAWVGFSLGAEKTTRYWLKQPEARPQLLVRLGGGWMSELEKSELRSAKSEGEAGETPEGGPRSSNAPHPFSRNARPATLSAPPATVLLIHGEQDAVFPVSDAGRVAAAFRAKGVPAELTVLGGQSHGFNPNRGVVFRAVGEYCLTRLRGTEALGQYRSIAVWQAAAWPLWVWGLPALAWGALWGAGCKWRGNWAGTLRAGKWAWGLAGGLALLALGLTAVHLGTPRLAVNDTTLALARRFLVQPEERKDFDHLAKLSCWQGQRVRTLLEHAHLARYNRRLVNWTVEDAVCREFVLSPVIEGGADENLRWRGALWESLYPRVRKEQSVEAAAETVVRHLRERVTIAGGNNLPRDIPSSWQRQLTDATGFHRLMVAGLRSVGVPARLNEQGRAELLGEGVWKPAPLPACVGLADPRSP